MKNYLDKNNKELKNGDIIDIHQTVNGQSQFVCVNVKKLDFRYRQDLHRKYEYSTEGLISPDQFNGTIEFEIIGNIKPLKDEALIALYNGIMNDYSIRRYSLNWKEIVEFIESKYKKSIKERDYTIQFENQLLINTHKLVTDERLSRAIEAHLKELRVNIETLNEKFK